MLLSIIVPSYDTENYISECLDSLIKQGFVDNQYEIIVVDDCSTDNTKTIIVNYAKQYPFIKPVFLRKNQGVSHARNVGLDIAIGKYVSFVDSDDIVSADIYSTLINAMEKMKLTYFNIRRTYNRSSLQQIDKEVFYFNNEKYIPLPVAGGVFK